jgi:hypothetical protein
MRIFDVRGGAARESRMAMNDDGFESLADRLNA